MLVLLGDFACDMVDINKVAHAKEVLTQANKALVGVVGAI